MKLNDVFPPIFSARPTNMVLAEQADYGGVQIDFYDKTDTDEIYMTREQIGQALGYVNPMIAIGKIHDRHRERLDKFSVLTKLGNTDGKSYDTYLYSAKGVYEICRWSRQPKADAFMDFVWEAVERIRKNKMTPPLTNEEIVDRAVKQITQKLFPQFVKTVSATLSKDIVERVRSLPQGEQLLQPVKAVEPAPKEKPKREYITLYVIFTWDLDGNVTVYKAKDYRDYMYTLKRITAEHKPYRVEKIRTATYK